MKILFVSHFSFLYGANRSLESLVMYFNSKGINVEVLLPTRGKFYDRLEERGIKVYTFRFFYEVMYVKMNPKYLSLPILWLYNLIAFPFLVCKVRKINPDVIYSNSSVDAYSIWVAKILCKKHVAHIREFMFEDFGARYVFGRKQKSAYLRKSNKIITVSKAVAKTVFGEMPINCKVIYNGLRIPDKVDDYEAKKGRIRLGVVGNIDISKQQDLAIRYMPQILENFPHVSLHIVGEKECPYKKMIKKLVHDLNLEKNVIFEGFVDNIDDIYKKIDVLLMCSRNEAFGRVTIEAMLRNIPVIGLDTAGTSELIDDGETGFKFMDCDGVISALNTIINNPDKTTDIVAKAKETAEIKFSELRYTEDVYQYIKDL